MRKWEKRKEGGRRGNACNKSPNEFNCAVAGGLKISIGQSHNWKSRPPFYAFIWCSVKMTDMDILSKALAVFNVVATRKFTLKPEQEVAVRALLEGKDVLAVLPTRYSKILIYQMFVRAKDYQLNALHK